MKSGLKVVHLSTAHPGTDTRVFVKECQSLAREGYDVTLIARGDIDGVEAGVRRISLDPMPAGRLSRITTGIARATRLAMEQDPDLVHLHDPELIPAGIYMRLRGMKVIYDAHESLSKQISSKSYIPRILRPPVSLFAKALTAVAGRTLSGIVAATPVIAEDFPRSKTVVVRNFAKREEFGDISTDDYLERQPLAVYIGGVTPERGAIEMADVSRQLRGEVLTIMAGKILNDDLAHELDSIDGDNLALLGHIGRDEVKSLLKRARVGLLVLHPEPNYLESLPVKLFEYMLAGIPVIASDFPFWRQFIADNDAGIMVNPLNRDAIRNAIQEIMTNPERAKQMGDNGRAAAEKYYTWEREAETLIDFYDRQSG